MVIGYAKGCYRLHPTTISRNLSIFALSKRLWGFGLQVKKSTLISFWVIMKRHNQCRSRSPLVNSERVRGERKLKGMWDQAVWLLSVADLTRIGVFEFRSGLKRATKCAHKSNCFNRGVNKKCAFD
eukprot:632392-Prorocentrum_minimum.AAC.5